MAERCLPYLVGSSSRDQLVRELGLVLRRSVDILLRVSIAMLALMKAISTSL